MKSIDAHKKVTLARGGRSLLLTPYKCSLTKKRQSERVAMEGASSNSNRSSSFESVLADANSRTSWSDA